MEIIHMTDESISNLFSLVLRRQPETLNLDMDDHGYSNPLFYIIIDSKEMVKDGFDFFLSENGVWPVSSVPSKYIMLNT
jgi:RNA:NAD 2'-phosphotransferase (TPT1/KptA family)